MVGVMPADFYFPSRTAEFWQPLAINPADAPRGAHYLGVVARLAAGTNVEAANTEMQGISERLALEYPDASANESAEVVPLLDQVVGTIRPALMTLLVAVGVVIIIVCANVANLLLVRASVREKEVAIRTALGAGRSRLILQMLAESLVLSVSGGTLGLLLAYLAIPAIQTLSAGSIPRVADVSIDSTVLAFSLAASVLTGLIFGLVPAWQMSQSGPGAALKDGSRSAVGGTGQWMRNSLLVIEVALSLVLLVGAALLLRSFAKLTNVDPGFNANGVLAFQISLPRATYVEDERVLQYYQQLTERLAVLPSVQSAAAVQTLPLRGGYFLSVSMVGRPEPAPGEEPSARYRAVTPDYFSTLGIPVVRGRAFAPQDSATSVPVALIDEAFAQTHFPGENPIGQRLDIGNGTDGAEIVGIVGNVSYSGLDELPSPTMYMPVTQDAFGTMWVMVRTAADPNSLGASVRQVVRDLDASLPVSLMSPLDEVVSESVAQQRFSMLLIAMFGMVALVLSAVGLYGVVAYSVSLRTREIGLRMAIGAMPGDVLKMVVGDGMKLAAMGVVIGTVAAFVLSRFVASMLFEVEVSDPVSYSGTALVLLLVAALACYIPARRAMRVDPMVTLQQD
jgi:putative ABC transport system permease protein